MSDDLSLRKWAIEQAIETLGGREVAIGGGKMGISAGHIESFALSYLQWVKGDPKQGKKNG